MATTGGASITFSVPFNTFSLPIAGATGLVIDSTSSLMLARPSRLSTGSAPPDPSTTASPTSWLASDGPYMQASKYCLPSVSSVRATDTPCYGAQSLFSRCSDQRAPQDQQYCFCNEASGQGYMYFEYLQGCSKCFRMHGALGGYGAYGDSYVNLFSSAYCGQNNPTIGLATFASSFERVEQVTVSQDMSTMNVLGTTTDVNLYFTTHLVGGYALSGFSSPGSGLSLMTRIGIGVGVGVGLAIILALVIALMLHRRARRRARLNARRRRKRSEMSKSDRFTDGEPGVAVDVEPGVAISRSSRVS